MSSSSTLFIASTEERMALLSCTILLLRKVTIKYDVGYMKLTNTVINLFLVEYLVRREREK